MLLKLQLAFIRIMLKIARNVVARKDIEFAMVLNDLYLSEGE